MATSDSSPEPSLSPLTSSAEATPASRSAKPGSGLESRTRGIFGPSFTVSFAYFDPATSSWKTSQGTFLSDLEEFSETWPDAGTMRNGSVYELQTSGPATSESGCSLSPTGWATPASSWHERGELTPEQWEKRQANRLTAFATPLHIQVATWPTARQEDGESCGNHPGAVDSLTGATKTWKTPHGMGNEDFRGKKGGAGGGEFALQANNWQPPATDSFRSRGGERKDEMGLDQQARMFPTPASRDYRTPNKRSFQERSGTTKGEQLQNFVEHCLGSPPAPPTPDGPPSSESAPTSRRLWPTPDTAASGGCKPTAGTDLETQKRPDGTKAQVRLQHLTDQGKRRLNPRFVEWLMGLPIGWTEP